MANRTKSWNAPVVASRQRPGLMPARSCPSTVIRPALGRYMPVSSLIKVDLPAPFSPTTATVEPAFSVRQMSVSAGVSWPG